MTRLARCVASPLLILGALVATASFVHAGSFLNPEITDPTGDADANHADLVGAWIEQDAKALGFYFHVAYLPRDYGAIPPPATDGPQRDLAQAEAVAEHEAYHLSFTAGASHWEVTVGFDGPPPGVAGWNPHVLRDGHELIPAGLGHNNTVYDLPEDSVQNQVGLRWFAYAANLPNGTTLTNLRAYTTGDSPPATSSTPCGDKTVRDCAPNTGYGRDFTVGGETLPTIPDLQLAFRNPHAVITHAGKADLPFTIHSTSPDQHRTFALSAKAPPGWTALADPSQIHLMPGDWANGTVHLTAPGNASGQATIRIVAEYQGQVLQSNATVTVQAAPAPPPSPGSVPNGTPKTTTTAAHGNPTSSGTPTATAAPPNRRTPGLSIFVVALGLLATVWGRRRP